METTVSYWFLPFAWEFMITLNLLTYTIFTKETMHIKLRNKCSNCENPIFIYISWITALLTIFFSFMKEDNLLVISFFKR